jgi:virginiamycin B lyase
MHQLRPSLRGALAPALAATLALSLPVAAQDAQYVAPPKAEIAVDVAYYDLPKGDRPHDVAPAPDGTVWYTGQRAGVLGRLDPKTGAIERVPLGDGSAPHGVIVGPDGAAWVTDGGLNAIVRVDPKSLEVKAWPLPKGREDANLNTAAFDGNGRIWFTGQSGIYGRLDPKAGDMQVWDAPRGRGPYGITATPSGDIWFVSLAGSYLAKPDLETGAVTPVDPPAKGSGTRRVWADSKGRLWVSEWNAGTVSVYNPQKKVWQTWPLPGEMPRAYAVFVDEKDMVWVSDFPGNAIVRFDPETADFVSYVSDREHADVRQMLGRPGELWGAESGTDRLVVIRYGETGE